jgi:hypothetical protein
MPEATTVNKSECFGAAILFGAVAFLTVPAPAQATPNCSQWGFPGNFSLNQSNGLTVRFNSTTGPIAHGTADSRGGDHADWGNVDGGIQGDSINFIISWTTTDTAYQDSPPTGVYGGSVGSDGFAHGDTEDRSGRGPGAHWDSTVPLVCIKPTAPPPAAAPPPAEAPAPAAPPAPNGLPADTVVTPFPDRRSVPPLTSGQ